MKVALKNCTREKFTTDPANTLYVRKIFVSCVQFFGWNLRDVHKFPITEYKTFSELPLARFNSLKFSVYILDFNWNYLFINDFAKTILGKRAEELAGKNLWTQFEELQHDPSFRQLKANMEKRITTNIVVVSPVHGKRQNITGYALDDCFYFSVSILPDKENLIEELRQELGKKNKS